MTSNLSQSIDALIQNAIDQNHIPGAVVWVSVSGRKLKHQAYGCAQLYDNGMLLDQPLPMRKNTLFDLASITKVMATTLGIMRLISDGILTDLETPISHFLPTSITHDTANITLVDLLTHTSGLIPWLPLYLDVNTPTDAWDYLCRLPLQYTTGEQRCYSDLNFMLLGYIIEILSNQTLDHYLATKLYQPLVLDHVRFKPGHYTQTAATSWGNPYEYQMIADNNLGYTIERDPDEFVQWRHYTLRGEVNDGNAFYTFAGVAGHAGLFATASDLAKLGHMLLDGGQYRQHPILSQSVVEQFTAPQRFGQGYGFEIDNASYMGQHAPMGTFGHMGFTGTHIVLNRQYHTQIIVLTNRQNLGVNVEGRYRDTKPLAAAIADAVFQTVIGNGCKHVII